MKAPYDRRSPELTVKRWAWKNRIEPRLVAKGKCREWRGHKDRYGYGQITLWVDGGPRTFKCHKIAIEATERRLLPRGRCALHTCDNRKCCRPSHIYEGGHLRNAIDREARGRGNRPKGSRNPGSVLTESKVRKMRSEATGKRGDGARLARRYNVTTSLVCRILARKIWKHV